MNIMSYLAWNDKIYEYFFRDNSLNDTIFFCVDADTINHIGKSLNISFGAEDDFCKTVLDVLLIKKDEKYYKLPTESNFKNLKYATKYPPQTALIAFMIYIASKMGENPEYSARAYWTPFRNVVEKYYEFYDKNIQNANYNLLFKIFEDFEDKLNSQFDINFAFQSLFVRKDRRDFVGLPMFQSMINTKDRCILSKKFYDYKIKHSVFDDCRIFLSGEEYSSVFKKIRDNNEYRASLIARINAIAQSWDGTVYEYNSARKSKQRSVLPLLYQYKINSNNEFKFYISTNNLEEIDISFANYQLNQAKPRESVEANDITLKEIVYQIENSNLKISRTKSEYVLFKKDLETNLYTEVTGDNKVQVGDVFSLLAPVEFFNSENNSVIENLISSYDEENSCEIADGLFLLHGAVAENYDNKFVHLSKKDKVFFVKGLKAGYKTHNIYIKGAEPLIKIDALKKVIIDKQEYMIEKRTEYGQDVYQKTLDIRKVHNECEEHTIRLENSEFVKTYEICPFSDMLQAGDNIQNIYNIISAKMQKEKFENPSKKMVLGACLKNFDDEQVYSNHEKIAYVLKILEQHKNEKKFIMPLSLKNEIQKLVLDNPEINAYIKDNLYIDNYICKYLNRLREV